MTVNLLPLLPSVEILLNEKPVLKLIDTYGRDLVLKMMRETLDVIRKEALSDQLKETPAPDQVSDWVVTRFECRLKRRFEPSLRRAINASGVVLHTGLGRAVMPESAVAAIGEVSKRYCTLATSVETGRRGHRDSHLYDLICELTGAEAATVVNNNCAATMVVLNTLAQGKEVVVSRGQLVEIGGAFRMPEVMETSGATLHAVGTTNKTHLRDYRGAIGEETGALMRVHHSNYRILGFASEPSVADMAALAHEHGVYMFDDIGSGALYDLSEFGLEKEPMVRESIKAGVDVACFSGDKLIGGPQSGIIVGKAEVIKKISKNPLTRACRVDKMTIAGLQATLQLFLKPDELTESHPVYAMFAMTRAQLSRRAHRMRRGLVDALGDKVDVSVIDGQSQVGSGSVPVETMPTKILNIKSEALTADVIGKKLRQNRPAIFPRVHKNAVQLDFRTIHRTEDKAVLDALLKALT